MGRLSRLAPPISSLPGCHFGRWRVPNDPESELARFLASLAAYKRKEFQHGASSFTPDEVYEWCKEDLVARRGLQAEYERLLRRIPSRWREYREREGNAFVQSVYPANPTGRPRKDDLAKEAAALKAEGFSYAQIEMRLNREHGEGTTTKENIRGLLKARRLHPSKTALPPE